MNTDRIEKEAFIAADHSAVWRAISNSAEFGTWFGMKFDGPFEQGTAIHGVIAPTAVDSEVAEMQKPYAGLPVELLIDRIEPERLFSFRWHPFAIERDVDYSAEPMTLIEFALKDHPDGVLLTITESGFDRIPVERRAKALAANDGGWTKQLELIAKYLQP
jgi:uncharacterized protein YndB with AHSA1/START domain